MINVDELVGKHTCVIIDIDEEIKKFNDQINKAYGGAAKQFCKNLRDGVITYLLESGVQFNKETGEIL